MSETVRMLTLAARGVVAFLTSVLCALPAFAEEGTGPAQDGAVVAKRPPNIVLVLVDDLRWDAVGPERPVDLNTPHLDRLRAEGARFENAFVPTSMCCPSRASLLTGKYPHETGVHSNRAGEDFHERNATFPERLQARGYETACVGKWHIPRDPPGPRPGFDHWVGFEDQGEYFEQELDVDGELLPTRGHSADALTERAVQWLAQPREKPCFLLLSFKNCHLPFVPPARHRGLLADAPLAWPPSFLQEPADLIPTAREARLSNRNRAPHAHPEEYLDVVRAYWELLPSVDEGVGRVLDVLEGQGVLDDTLFVFTSDNGYMLGEHGLTQKQLSYEPSIRVPLIVRYPALVPAGSAREELVLNVDLCATVLDLAGAEALDGQRGRSLLDGWRGSTQPWRRDFLYMAPWTREDPEFRELAVRDARWKYVRVASRAGVEERLFDLELDPEEVVDLSNDVEHEAELERLRERMAALREELAVPSAW